MGSFDMDSLNKLEQTMPLEFANFSSLNGLVSIKDK